MAENPQQAKDFLLEHMAKSEREQGRSPQTRRNDGLAQEILGNVDARPKPKPKAKAPREPGVATHRLGDIEVRVTTHTPEETARRRRMAAARARVTFANPETALKMRRLRQLKNLPEFKNDFRQVHYWKTVYPRQNNNDPGAQAHGNTKARQLVDWLLGEAEKRFGPWWLGR